MAATVIPYCLSEAWRNGSAGIGPSVISHPLGIDRVSDRYLTGALTPACVAFIIATAP